MELYHLNYYTHENGRGVAAVTAMNPKQAEQVLRTQGRLNATPEAYIITKVVKIGDTYTGDPCLLGEENTEWEAI